MKGMSFKDKQSPIKGYSRGNMNSPILKDYFKTSLFGGEASVLGKDLKTKTGKYDLGASDTLETDKSIEKGRDTKLREGKEMMDKSIMKDEIKKETGATSKMNPELMLAATMPIGYMIGKGLTALFGKKGKKEQQAEELAAAEKKGIEKGKKDVYKHEDHLRDEAKRREENPTVDKPTKGLKEIKVKTKKNPYGI